MAIKKPYVVAPGQTIWHSKEEKYYREGEPIDLSHLNDEQLAAVLVSGAVVESKPKEKEQPHE